MKVAIDPGHGMSNRKPGLYDPGATHMENASLYEEAAIALKYGLCLRDELRARGVEVFMTRDDAQDHAPVGSRARNASNAHCDVLISLHLNDFDDDSANGLEVLYGSEASRTLAQQLQTRLVGASGFKNRQIKRRDDLAVLKFNGPAALIELGFIAHDGNREALLNPQMRSALCQTIAEVLLSRYASAQPQVPIPLRAQANAAPAWAAPA